MISAVIFSIKTSWDYSLPLFCRHINNQTSITFPSHKTIHQRIWHQEGRYSRQGIETCVDLIWYTSTGNIFPSAITVLIFIPYPRSWIGESQKKRYTQDKFKILLTGKQKYRPTIEKCSNITGVTIPDGVINIRKNSFYLCIYLMSVTMPDSVTSIGESGLILADCFQV